MAQSKELRRAKARAKRAGIRGDTEYVPIDASKIQPGELDALTGGRYELYRLLTGAPAIRYRATAAERRAASLRYFAEHGIEV